MSVRFTATKLNSTGKKGLLKPDENGYYEMVIGGLNILNSVGEMYLLEGAKKLFEESSVLMRRIKNGNLKAEYGHPPKTPGMTNDQYINRIFSIDETNVCAHFKEIWLDESYGKNNPELGNSNLVAIMAKVKPAGPKGEALKASLDNPDENVCFSVRGMTEDYFSAGRKMRVLVNIQCWDVVSEPGLSVANKYDSPALETLTDVKISRNDLITVRDSDALACLATEDSKLMIDEALAVFDSKRKPHYSHW